MDKQNVDLSHGGGFPGIRRDLRRQHGNSQTKVANKLNNFIDETRISTKEIKTTLEKQGEENQSILKQFKRQNIMYESVLYHISEQEKMNQLLQKQLRTIESDNQTLLNVIKKQSNVNLNNNEKKINQIQNRQNNSSKYLGSTNKVEQQPSNTTTSTGINNRSNETSVSNKRIEGDEDVFNSEYKNQTYSKNVDDEQSNIPYKIKVDARILDLIELQYNLDTRDLRKDERLQIINENNEAEDQDEEQAEEQVDELKENDEITQKNNTEDREQIDLTVQPEDQLQDDSTASTDERDSKEKSNNDDDLIRDTKTTKKFDSDLNTHRQWKNNELGAISRYYIEKNQSNISNKTSIRSKGIPTNIKKNKSETKSDKQSKKNQKQYKMKINARFLDFLENKYNVDTTKLKENKLVEIVKDPIQQSQKEPETMNHIKKTLTSLDKHNDQQNPQLETETIEKKDDKLEKSTNSISTEKANNISGKAPHCKEDCCGNLFTCGDRIEVYFPTANEEFKGIYISSTCGRLVWRNTTKGNRIECTSCDFISIRKLN